MAAFIIDFDPIVHQKVRYHDQLYVVFLKDYDFFQLPPDAEVLIHFVSHNKVIVQQDKSIQPLYTVRKRELIVVAPEVEE